MLASLSTVFKIWPKGGKNVGRLLEKTSFFDFLHSPSNIVRDIVQDERTQNGGEQRITNLNYGKGVFDK